MNRFQPDKYRLITIMVIAKSATKVIVVAIAAPATPKEGISKIFRIISNATQTAPIRKIICTFPMLERVAPTAIKDAPMANPGSKINSGRYDARNNSPNKNEIM